MGTWLCLKKGGKADLLGVQLRSIHSIRASKVTAFKYLTSFYEKRERQVRFSSEVRGSPSPGVWSVCRSEILLTPKAAPTGFTQVKPQQWACLIFQNRCPQCVDDVMKSEALSVSCVAAWRLTADSRRSCQGFPRARRQPTPANVQGFAFTFSSLALCYGSVELCINQDHDLVCGCRSCVSWLPVCYTTPCPSTLV